MQTQMERDIERDCFLPTVRLRLAPTLSWVNSTKVVGNAERLVPRVVQGVDMKPGRGATSSLGTSAKQLQLVH